MQNGGTRWSAVLLLTGSCGVLQNQADLVELNDFKLICSADAVDGVAAAIVLLFDKLCRNGDWGFAFLLKSDLDTVASSLSR